jgi:hypothetical protein
MAAIFSSPSENQNFILVGNNASNSYIFSPTNNICVPSYQQPEKIQNYFQFRCATYQRVNKFFHTPFLFIKKQTNILAPHPGRFYFQQKTNMTNESNTQEYCRYRDAQYQTSTRVCQSMTSNFD